MQHPLHSLIISYAIRPKISSSEIFSLTIDIMLTVMLNLLTLPSLSQPLRGIISTASVLVVEKAILPPSAWITPLI